VCPFKTLLIFSLVSLLAVCLLQAQRVESGKRHRVKLSQGQIRLAFLHHTGRLIHHDSVLVIFDRSDRSGAGIIYGAFELDSNHSVLITRVPVGRYFVMVQCLGMHHDYWETTTWVHPRKCGTLKISLEACEEFRPGHAYIPVFRPNMEKLTITTMRATGGSRQRRSSPVY
jgi:hypothetical protein